MSAHSLRWGAAQVDLSDAGVVTAVVHDADPGRSYLVTAGELRVVQDGTPATRSSSASGRDTSRARSARSRVTRPEAPSRPKSRGQLSRASWW